VVQGLRHLPSDPSPCVIIAARLPCSIWALQNGPCNTIAVGCERALPRGVGTQHAELAPACCILTGGMENPTVFLVSLFPGEWPVTVCRRPVLPVALDELSAMLQRSTANQRWCLQVLRGLVGRPRALCDDVRDLSCSGVWLSIGLCDQVSPASTRFR